MTAAEISQVKPGKPLGVFREMNGGAVLEDTIREGEIPEDSDLSAAFTLDDAPTRRVVAALRKTGERTATIGLQQREGAEKGPAELRHFVKFTMDRSGVDHVELDQGVTNIPLQDLEEAGLAPNDHGVYEHSRVGIAA